MDELRYPIGMQTFSNLIEDGYVYVDKTHYIKPLLSQGKFVFLSRPRRFGKSLMLSTLEAYFEGRRELFNGLAANSMDLDWTPSPVLRFDFNAEDYSAEDGLSSILNRHLKKYEKKYGINDVAESIAGRFENLIERVVKTADRQVVILIDEYDKPLLAVDDNKELFEKNQHLLKSFYGNLKTMDRYIRFAFITGVARFSKVSIFSDLNNLDDISMSDRYADICGWSEDELIENCAPGIKVLSEKRGEDFDTTLRALREYYDGYLFSEDGSRLYNPFSILKALKDRRIDPYWFHTGTPTFLVKRIRARGIFPADINGVTCSREQLISVSLNDANPIPLMFQTGYLSIADFDRDTGLYELRFPNREVEIGFYQGLLPVYAPEVDDPFSPFSFAHFKTDIAKGRPKDFMERLNDLLKGLPGEDHCESTYRAVTYLLAVLCGVPAIAEHHSYKGRSDLEVFTGKYIYVFEFKYNRSVKEAMTQIHSRDYAGRYSSDRRTVYLIGANFNDRKDDRGLEYTIEMLES